MIKFENYCKPNGRELLGIPGAFDDEIDGELSPCPICGGVPKPMVREDRLDGYFAAVSCFNERGAAHAYVSAKGHSAYPKILGKAIAEWNNGIIEIYEGRKKCLYDRHSKTMHITTKDSFGKETTYKVVDKIPAGFQIWNIGQHNMGNDKYIPLCYVISNSDGLMPIDKTRIYAMYVGRERAKLLMNAAGCGVNSLASAEKALKNKKDMRMHEYAKETIEIFREISE